MAEATAVVASVAEATTNNRAFEVLLALPHGISESGLTVTCCRQNDRQQSTPDNERSIDTIWKDRIASDSSLFNGSKFRFENVQYASSSLTVLNLGITDYKSFLGTNLATHWQQLQPQALASPLGNAAIVETSDRKVVLLQRSGNVGEMPHTIVMPGGHPEPEMVGIKTMDDWVGSMRSDDDNDDDNPAWNNRIRYELWDSMIREVVEETGITREALGDVLCIGFTRRVQNYRPDIIFYIPCNLTSEEVRRLYEAGPEHKSESTELITMDRLEFVKRVIEEDLLNMPGCHRGGVELYRQYLAKRNPPII